jgi:hypothetical protein
MARATSSLPLPLGPSDEHAGIGRCYLLDHFAHQLYACRSAYHLGTAACAHLFAQHLGLGDQVGAVEGIAHRNEQAVEVQRLGDVVVGTALQGIDSRFDGAMAADHHHRGVGRKEDDAVEHFGAVHLGHLDVAEDDVILRAFDLHHALQAVLGLIHLYLFIFEYLADGAADGAFVIDDKSLGHCILISE